MNDCEHFSLALDGSTDVVDGSQLLIYTRAINRSFQEHEELLKLASLQGTYYGHYRLFD